MRRPITTVLLVLLAASANSEVRRWELGGEGLSWRSNELNSTAISYGVPGSIQLVGFNSNDNIVQQLKWTEGHPLDFIEEAGARVWDNVPFKQSNTPLIDGDLLTSSDIRFKEFGLLQGGRRFFFDLGTRFPVNRIVFFPRPDGADSRGRPFADDFIRGYKIQVNDGDSFSPQNLPIYELLSQVDFTNEGVAETRIPLQFVRYLQLNVTSDNPFEIAEFQVFGAGFAPGGRYRSQIVDLGEAANFQQLLWDFETLLQEDGTIRTDPEGDARVSFRMRTGKDETPRVYYEIINVFTGDTQEVSENAYNKLQANVRGPVEDDRSSWSEWSAPFTEPGEPIDLPSPRQYFQLEATLESRSILSGLRVNSLVVEHSIPPLAQQLIGEISVLQDPRPLGDKPRVPAGESSTFAYDVRADVTAADVGFDAIQLFTPGAPVFRDFLIGDPLVPVTPDSLIQEEGSLTLFFPSRRLTEQSPNGLRIVFETQVFVQATLFSAQVFDTQSDEAPQRVLAGDANPTVSTNDLRVLTTAASARNLLPFFQVTPGVLTPNGDGINDLAGLSYTLVQLRQPVHVDVEILDLSGRRVRTLFSGLQGSGSATRQWDGRDDAGKPVPVGIYIASVDVDAERQNYVRLGTVGVVY
jgi:hypothetical protein